MRFTKAHQPPGMDLLVDSPPFPRVSWKPWTFLRHISSSFLCLWRQASFWWLEGVFCLVFSVIRFPGPGPGIWKVQKKQATCSESDTMTRPGMALKLHQELGVSCWGCQFPISHQNNNCVTTGFISEVHSSLSIRVTREGRQFWSLLEATEANCLRPRLRL